MYRSALEWMIDQYQVGADKRCGVTADRNCADDPEYIARCFGTSGLNNREFVIDIPEIAC